MVGMAGLTQPCRSQTLYDFGNPTAEEQLYLETVNRARANPSAEGARLAASTDTNVLAAYSQYSVNLTKMQTEFNALPVTPPLAPNAKLTSTARSHSAWMLAHDTQTHDETSPANTPFTRMTAAGYAYSTAAETSMPMPTASCTAIRDSKWTGVRERPTACRSAVDTGQISTMRAFVKSGSAWY